MNLVLAALYASAMYYSMSMLTPIGSSPIWIASGILLAVLMLQTGRVRAYTAAGSFVIAGLVALANGHEPIRSQGLNALSLCEALLTLAVAKRVCGHNPDFADGRRLLAFVLGAVLPVSLIVNLVLRLPAVASAFPPHFANSFSLSHLVGATVVTPALLVLLQRRRYRAIRRPPGQVAAALAAFAVAVFAVFLAPIPAPFVAVVLPMIFALAFVYGPVAAAAGGLVVGLAASLSLALVVHPNSGTSVASQVLMLQFFTIMAIVASLPAAGVVATHARMRALLSRRSETARSARRRADAAAASRSEFLANMSHEIRTPLNGVLGLAEALARTETLPGRREMLEMIQSSGKGLNQLLGDAIELARADSGELKLVHEPFDVRETVGAAAFLFEAVAREKGLGFQVTFDLDPPGAVVGDPLRIRQVISNLISNAIKFTPEGSVTVHCSLKGQSAGVYVLEARVQDTGVGFDHEIKARLFNRFEQGDNSVTRRFGGSGLGLAIARKLIQMMGGEIGCESTPGGGSSFYFSVSLEAAPGMMPVAVEPAEFGGSGRLAVLLAEDHPVNRKVIEALLDDLADITVAENGRTAMDAFNARTFDLVLMDTHMPVMDGLEAIRAMRAAEKQRRWRRTPVISLTADAMPQQIAAALAAGADLHLSKPVTGASLISAIEKVIADQPEVPTRRVAGLQR